MDSAKFLTEVTKAKKEFVTDGYTMSIGEIVSMYKEDELIISPDFQRAFRWSIHQQSKLIESVLIGVPLPSIFVFQNESGKWEVVDGVQRLSTILQFLGELRDDHAKKLKPSVLEETKLIPSLKGASWREVPKEVQLDFKRTRLEIKIIKFLSDKNAKFEVFQRLNYSPTILSGQEYRNALLIMIDKPFYLWMNKLSENRNFRECIDLTDRWVDEKYHQELALRLFIFPAYPLKYTRVDEYINESLFYIDDSLLHRVATDNFSLDTEGERFEKVFDLLKQAGGTKVFKKPGKGQQFLESYFEAIAIGLYSNIDSYTESDVPLIKSKIEAIDAELPRALNTTSRIPKTVEFGKKYFRKGLKRK